MRTNLCRLLFVMLIALMSGRAAIALEKIGESPDGDQKTGALVRELLSTGQFGRLEEMADRMWQQRSRRLSGVWELAGFYSAFRKEGAMDWSDWLRRFEEWERAFPESATARAAHAIVMTQYAWDARGAGWAETVTPEGGKLFGERLQVAQTLLEKERPEKRGVGYYIAMMTIALGQGWPKEAEAALFADAVKLAPDFERFYYARALYLQAKWYGEDPDEWHRFAISAAEATRQELGMTMYTRTVWSVLTPKKVTARSFRDANIDWPRMKQGFEDLARQFPGSVWNKNAFCFYAQIAGDRVTAQRLFKELDGRYALEIWQSAAKFSVAQRWANDPRNTQ